MIKTALLLILALIILPVVAIYFNDPLSDLQWQMIRQSFLGTLLTALLCFAVSELARNYSQIDKIWSLMPIAYSWYFAFESQWNVRLVLMAVLVSLWGIRLTYNFGRKGAYSWKFWEGEEDYRWKELRKTPALQARWRWMAFNLFFISLYQSTLIWLFTLPSVAAVHGADFLGWADIMVAGVFIFFLVIEIIADEQMWKFQQEKKKGNRTGEGFICTGLWSIVRHPNYTAEQGMWVSFYFFSVAATGDWINWSMTGCVLLLLLFQGSSDFSESISSAKYPAYKKYRKSVPRFIPFLK